MKFERKGKAKRLTNEEIDNILNSLLYPHKLIFLIQRYTGARISEVISLKANDINLKEKRLNIEVLKSKSKKRKYRQLPIHDNIIEILSEYIKSLPEGCIYLFPGNKGKSLHNHISSQSCDKALRNACLYLGYTGVSTHSFRVTVINNIWDNMSEKNPVLLAAFTGHSNIASLSEYLIVNEKEKDNLSNMV